MISCKNVSKYYETYKSKPGMVGAIEGLFKREITKKLAVNDISFSIDEGKIVGLLGPNGAGKTTMLKMLSGLLLPTSGEINIAGYTPFEKKNEFKKLITFVMGQKTQLWWDISAMETFILNKNIYEINDKQFNETINYLMDIFNVKDCVDVQVRRLSFGQRMKLEIINSLIHNPKIVFLDEPTIGLDFDAQHSIRNFIKEYNKEFKSTFIITSHYLDDIETVCDDIIVINNGEKIINDSINNVMGKFSGTKILKITLEEPIKDLNTIKKYGEIVEYNENVISIKAYKQDIKDLVNYCVSNFSINDINVAGVPFEHIIKEIYNNRGEYNGVNKEKV